MAVIKAALVTAALLAAPASVRAEARTSASPGGEVGPFLELLDRVRAPGERVVIDGPCLSACTLVLSTVPGKSHLRDAARGARLPRRARLIDRRGRTYAEPEASEAVLEAYPAAVRGWISRHGGLTSRLLLLRGRTSRRSTRDVVKSHPFGWAVDHPGNPELVDAHAKPLAQNVLL